MPLHKSLEIFTAQTLCNIGILFSILSFLLHIGRPYFERILGRFTLRVASDLWWVVYIMLRDGSLLLAVLFGFLHLNMDLMADIKIGLPFVPFGTVVLAAALLVKVLANSEDVNKHYRRSTLLVTFGALLNTIGYVFVMEAPGGEYSASHSWFWMTLVSMRSNVNPELSAFSFYISFSLLMIVLAVATFRVLTVYGSTNPAKADDVQASR
jgi:hypothetical protein